MTNNTNFSGALSGGNDDLDRQWDQAESAKEYEPVPRGEYICHVVDGRRMTASTGTRGYLIVFRVIEGEHAGRKLWHRVWLTESALPLAKRDLAKLGITKTAQLDEPVPPGIRCKVQAVVKKPDRGPDCNEVRSFTFVQIDQIEPDPLDTDEDPELPV